MNILYLVHRLPYPPDKGDKIRAYHQLRHLARGHRVWCAGFVDDSADRNHAAALREHCADVAAIKLRRLPAMVRGLVGLARGDTVTESFYASQTMRAVLARWCEQVKFDVVVAFSSSMASYALRIPADRRVLDLCDADSQKWLDYAAESRGLKRRIYQAEGTRLGQREIEWINAFDATTIITAAEAALIDPGKASNKLHVVANGVNLPTVNAEATEDSLPTVGFVGVMDYRPNVEGVRWFVRTCWPKIRAAVPEAQFRIVGRSPNRTVRRLSRIKGVTVTGRVENVADELNRLHVSVAPLRIARGLQNKVLEAMAASKAVVLTSGAATGVDAVHGRDYLVADRGEEMAAHVIRLLSSPRDRRILGHAARRFVASKFAWEPILRHFELVVTGMVERTARRYLHTEWDEKALDETVELDAVNP